MAQALSVNNLERAGIRLVRLQYPDLHGVCRGKDLPVEAFAHAVTDGVNFVEAIMTLDLAHNVVSGFEVGFPDFLARPDLSTLVAVPWEPHVAVCVCDLYDGVSGEPYAADPRGALRRVLAQYDELGFGAELAPEFEFYLCEPDAGSGTGWRSYAGKDSPPYTVGYLADPRGILGTMMEAASALGLDVLAGAHEYGRSQYEINLRHGAGLGAADRAFRYKELVKELAAREGLLATFMGKPFNGDEGSGFHLHISLCDDQGNNRSEDAEHPSGLANATRYFIAGVIEHCPAMMVFFNPTVNAYRRISA
jgi:glutamine synthetase